ncbi:SusC/RagA family TonB-linked outer membrane protein [Deminuibacter soli]|uniref:SusC/RagA family TonB-linked outer membrane protein n=2 Tax=Deminuibacter soli TaxID=2291815 RepID=A0A3E1NH54_9BACT|nr:SusC/RagA family TonB-linked outer membrane protein [Deminuibacter soli]
MELHGIVTEKGVAVGNATVFIKQPGHNTLMTLTDDNGRFSKIIPAEDGSVEISSVGFYPVKRTFTGVNQGEMAVELSKDVKEIDGVVVTALGIKREERSLGYSATTIKGEQLTDAMSGNWADALSGKVAGLNLIRSNAGPAGSIKVILRGENNLTGDNEALIVVDGVVINQGSGRRTGTAGSDTYGTGSDNMPADYGSNFNDLNPDDIETVTILKGPGASALYGQRGANGAVIITTKSGGAKKRMNVNVNSNYSLEKPNRWPDLQYEYGQGLDGAAYYSWGASADGASTSGTSSAYGPKFDGQKFFQFNPGTQSQDSVRTLWRPYKNQTRDYFTTGKTFTNSVSVDGGTDKTTARFSVTNVNNDWIVPNTGYKRNSVALSVNSKLSDKLTISSKVTYNNKWSDNLPGAGYGNQSIMYWYIFWQPSADLNWLKNYWVKGKEQQKIEYPFSSYPENPYAIAYEFLNASNRNAVTGNIQATYNFNKQWSFQVRTSLDMSYDARNQKRPWDAGTKLPKGSYRTQNIFSIESSADFLLRYSDKITRDLSINASAGGSILKNRYNKDENRADSLAFPGVYSLANNAGPLVTLPYKSEYAINSFYGLVSLNYKSYLYADFTGRQDYNSALATPTRTANAGFFYTSANFSFVASDVLRLPKVIDYAKLRFSASSVGSGGTEPYLTSYNYASAGSLYNGGLSNPSLLTNPNLKPLRTITYEAGANISMLNNRVNLDVTVYTGNTRDQILKQYLDQSSGWVQKVVNAGKVNNKGIEIALNVTPVQTKTGFKWSTGMVFSANTNKIVSLPDSSIVLKNGPVGGGQIVAKVGGSMGDMYGRGYLRAPDGQIVYDSKTGIALLTQDVVYLGNTIPKWKAGLTNDFTYKQFTLHTVFDVQYGGVAHSLTHYKLAEQGKTTNTLPGRYNGIIGNGVVQDGEGHYRKNDVIATDIDEYYRSHYGQDNAEGSTFRTDFIKFREASIYYTLNPKIAKRMGLQRVQIGIYGRDLFIWSKWPIFDPEFGTLDGSDIIRGFEIGQFPSTRSFGVNLNVGL